MTDTFPILLTGENLPTLHREYYDDSLGRRVNLDNPDWSKSTRADLERVLVETGAWEQSEAAEYSLPRLHGICLWLLEGRYDEEGGE